MSKVWIDRAFELARRAAAISEVPVGAVIVSEENELLSEGHNLRETVFDPLGHAELLAIRSAATRLASWRLDGASLFVTLEPCVMCLAAAQQARLKQVVYTALDPKGGGLSLGYKLNEDPRLNHRFPCVYEEDPRSSALLKKFFQDLRTSRS